MIDFLLVVGLVDLYALACVHGLDCVHCCHVIMTGGGCIQRPSERENVLDCSGNGCLIASSDPVGPMYLLLITLQAPSKHAH